MSTTTAVDLANVKPVARLLQLDALRGVAVLLVMGHHVVIDSHHAGRLRPFVGFLQRFGWTGVDLFFVLSGFLVGGLLFEELRLRSTVAWGRFVIRRLFKIWPSYYAFVLAMIALSIVVDGMPPRAAIAPYLSSLLHVQNYIASPKVHLWSLAVEEHFYLLLPLALFVLFRGGAARTWPLALPLMSLLLTVGCTAARCWVNLGAPYSDWHQTFPTHLRVDSLFFGVLLAYLFHLHRPRCDELMRNHRPRLLPLGLVLLLPMAILPVDRSVFVRTFGFVCLYVGYGAILLWARYAQEFPRALGPISRVGVSSYPIYLWHLSLGHGVANVLLDTKFVGRLGPEARWLMATASYMSIAVAGGAMLGHLIERPALALRDRLFPRSA